MTLEETYEKETGNMARSNFSPSLEYCKWIESKLNGWLSLKSRILNGLEKNENENLDLIDEIHSI